MGRAVLRNRARDADAEVIVRQLKPGSPVQALVRVECDHGSACLESLISSDSGRLVDPQPFHEAMRARYPVPTIV